MSPPQERTGTDPHRYGPPLPLTLTKVMPAVVVPLLAVGITAACSQLSADGDGDPWLLLAFLGIAGVLTVEYLVKRFPRDWLVGLTMLMLFALGSTASVVDGRVLQERGVEVTCPIVSVKERTIHVYNPHGGGGRRTTYDYHLDCPGGYPTDMSFDDRHGDVGDPLRVTYDPDRRVGPILTSDAHDRRDLWLAGLLLAASVVLRLAYALSRKDP